VLRLGQRKAACRQRRAGQGPSSYRGDVAGGSDPPCCSPLAMPARRSCVTDGCRRRFLGFSNRIRTKSLLAS
jgi:hypothetical protein